MSPGKRALVDSYFAAGFFHAGDRHAIKTEIDAAKLLPAADIDAMLEDIAKANALMASAQPEPATTVPPASAFYVLPWLQNASWPWSQMCALVLDLEGVPMMFSIEGVRPAGQDTN